MTDWASTMQAAAAVLSARLDPQSETQWVQQNECTKGTLQKSKKNSIVYSGSENDPTCLKNSGSQIVSDIQYIVPYLSIILRISPVRTGIFTTHGIRQATLARVAPPWPVRWASAALG
jgi:hypothetical protein